MNSDSRVFTVWAKDKDGNFKYAFCGTVYRCGYLSRPTKIPARETYLRHKDSFYRLPNSPKDMGTLPICEKCSNQLTCISNPIPEVHLSKETILD